jgi:glycosyltransferase involved in cell wall biosynthesis
VRFYRYFALQAKRFLSLCLITTDETANIARRIKGVSVLSTSDRGKGAAVIAAALHSDADFFGFIDADLSANPKDILTLLYFVERNDYDIAIGSRLVDSTKVRRGQFRTLSSRMFNIVRKAIVGVRVEDTQCGLKLMNARGKEILATCTETGWFFDIEFLARAERAGLRIKEVPIHWDEYRFPERASKLNYIRDSIESVRAMLRIRSAIAEK